MNTDSTIDLSKSYQVKQRYIEKDPSGLSDYKKSSYPDTSKLIFCPYNHNLKKFSTGLDVTHPSVLVLKGKEKEEKIKEITELKQDLEDTLGVDLSPKSEFWDDFCVVLGDDAFGNAYMDIKGKSYNLSPTDNPYHKVALIFLKFNNLVPGTKEEAGDPKFREAKYLLTTEDEINKDARQRVRIDIAKGKHLSELFGDKVNYDRAWEIAYYLGYKPKRNMSEDLLQELLYEKTMIVTQAAKFIEACLLKNEEIMTANLFKKAVILNIVKFNPTDKCYFRGGVNYRDTEEGSIELLKSDSFSTELAQLREAVDKKAKTMKNLG